MKSKVDQTGSDFLKKSTFGGVDLHLPPVGKKPVFPCLSSLTLNQVPEFTSSLCRGCGSLS